MMGRAPGGCLLRAPGSLGSHIHALFVRRNQHPERKLEVAQETCIPGGGAYASEAEMAVIRSASGHVRPIQGAIDNVDGYCKLNKYEGG